MFDSFWIANTIAFLALIISLITLVRGRFIEDRNRKLLAEEKRTKILLAIRQDIERLWAWQSRIEQILLWYKNDENFAQFMDQAVKKIAGDDISGAAQKADKLPSQIQQIIKIRQNQLLKLRKLEVTDPQVLERLYSELMQVHTSDELVAMAEGMYVRMQKLFEGYLDLHRTKREKAG